MATPAPIAASSATGTESVTLPATAAANAAARNWPSMDTLTTPARSQSTPHSAPKTSGVASVSVPANWLLTGKGRSRPAAAQVRKPMTTDRPATVGGQGPDPAPHPATEEADRRGEGEHRADGHGHRRPAPSRSAAEPRRTHPTSANRAEPVVDGSKINKITATTAIRIPVEIRCRRFSPAST